MRHRAGLAEKVQKVVKEQQSKSQKQSKTVKTVKNTKNSCMPLQGGWNLWFSLGFLCLSQDSLLAGAVKKQQSKSQKQSKQSKTQSRPGSANPDTGERTVLKFSTVRSLLATKCDTGERTVLKFSTVRSTVRTTFSPNKGGGVYRTERTMPPGTS